MFIFYNCSLCCIFVYMCSIKLHLYCIYVYLVKVVCAFCISWYIYGLYLCSIILCMFYNCILGYVHDIFNKGFHRVVKSKMAVPNNSPKGTLNFTIQIWLYRACIWSYKTSTYSSVSEFCNIWHSIKIYGEVFIQNLQNFHSIFPENADDYYYYNLFATFVTVELL